MLKETHVAFAYDTILTRLCHQLLPLRSLVRFPPHQQCHSCRPFATASVFHTDCHTNATGHNSLPQRFRISKNSSLVSVHPRNTLRSVSEVPVGKLSDCVTKRPQSTSCSDTGRSNPPSMWRTILTCLPLYSPRTVWLTCGERQFLPTGFKAVPDFITTCPSSQHVHW